MKRMIRFLVLFGFGLLALVLALGPGRLFRRSVEPTIAATDPDAVRPSFQVPDPGEQGRAIGLALQGAGRIPLWKESIEPDGSLLRVKAALLTYDGNEPFSGGFHLERPVVELYPGRRGDERPTARIRAGGADLATRGDAGQAAQLAQRFRTGDLREFTLAPAVVLEQLDEEGAVAITLETERLEAPEAPLPESGAPDPLARLVAPGPVHARRADSSFDLRAGGLDLDRVAGRLVLEPPLAIAGTDLSLPGLADAGGEDRARRPRPPFHLTADGRATFVRRAPAAASAAEPAAGALRFDRVLGPGELTFTRNVHVRQEDRWLRSDRVVVALDEDAEGRLIVTKLDAGVPHADVALGLLGGEGRARALHWDAVEQALVLDGPLEARELLIGEGADARKLRLAARGRMVARELAADGLLPARVEIELRDGARAEIPGELVATGARLLATLLPPARGGAAAVKLVAVELFGGEEPATVDLGPRGRARAQRRIRLVDGGADGRTVHLEGSARVDVERGYVEGEMIDVAVPGDPSLPTRLTVPVLAAAAIDLQGGGLLGVDGGGGTEAADAPLRLLLEPLAPCRLERSGEGADVVGRARGRVRSLAAARSSDAGGEPDLQTIEFDELHLLPDGGGGMEARALGSVVIDDPGRQLHATASFARTESAGAGGRRLVLDGAPAFVSFRPPPRAGVAPAGGSTGDAEAGAVEIASAQLVLDLATGALEADDGRDQVRIGVPEALLGPLLPRLDGASRPVDAPPAGAAARAVVRADHLVVTPVAGAATRAESLERARLDAHGRVSIERAGGGRVRCRELALDLERRFARLDGEADAPVVVEQPRSYAPDRVESITAAWIEVRGGGREMDVAPNAVFVFHPEETPTPERPLPELRRVELRASDAPRLRGARLLLGGGVESSILRGGEETRARSERAELVLDRPLDERGARPLRLNATQRVRLDHGPYHAEGALLSYEFAGPEAVGRLSLKEGVQPCTFVGQDSTGAWRATSRFREMVIHDPASGAAARLPIEQRVEIKGLELLVEGPREQ